MKKLFSTKLGDTKKSLSCQVWQDICGRLSVDKDQQRGCSQNNMEKEVKNNNYSTKNDIDRIDGGKTQLCPVVAVYLLILIVESQ